VIFPLFHRDFHLALTIRLCANLLTVYGEFRKQTVAGNPAPVKHWKYHLADSRMLSLMPDFEHHSMKEYLQDMAHHLKMMVVTLSSCIMSFMFKTARHWIPFSLYMIYLGARAPSL